MFFNPQQNKFFNAKGYETINCNEKFWPVKERSQFNNLLFAEYYRKMESDGSIILRASKCYNINANIWISPIPFIKGIYPIIFKSLSLFENLESQSWIAIGKRADFFHAIRFYLKERKFPIANFQKIEIHHQKKLGKSRLFNKYLHLFIISLQIIIGKRHFIFINSPFTRKIGTIMSLPNSYVPIRSLNFIEAVPLWKKPGQISKIPFLVKNELLMYTQVINDSSLKEAFEAYIDYYLKEELNDKIRSSYKLLLALEFIKPKAVVSILDSGIWHIVRCWCRVNNVKFLCIQHGFQSTINMGFNRKVDADVYFGWGKDNSNTNYLRTFKKTKIKWVGNPMYERTCEKKHHYSNEKKRILIAPAGEWWTFSDICYNFWVEIERITKSINVDDIEWGIRIHSKERFTAAVREFSTRNNISMVDKVDLFEDLKNSYLIITTVSSIAMDAFFIHRPVLIINASHQDQFFSINGVGIYMEDFNGLEKKLSYLLKSRSYYDEIVHKQNNFIKNFSKNNTSNIISDEILQALSI